MRTESSYYDEHLGLLIGRVEERIEVLEGQHSLSTDDVMELSALDELFYHLEDLRRGPVS